MKKYYRDIGRMFCCKLAAHFVQTGSTSTSKLAECARQKNKCEMLDVVIQTTNISKPTNAASEKISYKSVSPDSPTILR